MAFRERVLKTGEGRDNGMHDQLVESSDWRVVRSSGVHAIKFLVPVVWGLCAGGQHTVNSSHLLGVPGSAKQLRGRGSEYHLQPSRGDLRVLDFA